MAITGVFKFEDNVASVNGVPIKLSGKKLAIFQSICESNYQPISKIALYRRLFPEFTGRDDEITIKQFKLLESHVSQLRNVINRVSGDKVYGNIIDGAVEGYITVSKPFGAPGQKPVKFHGMTLDLETGVLLQDIVGRNNEVTYVPHTFGYTEKRLLFFLAADRNRVKTSEQIFAFVYENHLLVGADASPDNWDIRLGKLVIQVGDKLDAIEVGASAFIEKMSRGYKFAGSPDLMKVRNPDAVLAHEEDFDPDDPEAIAFGDLSISPNSKTITSVDPPPGLIERTVVLTPPEWAILNILRQKENYGRYLRASEIFNLKTGKTHRGYDTEEIKGWAISLAAKVNAILRKPLIHVETTVFCVAAGDPPPALPPEIAKEKVKAGILKPFTGGVPLRIGDIEFDPTCHVVRNVTKPYDPVILGNVPGRLFEYLLRNQGKPLDINVVIKEIDTTFISLRSSGLIKELDEALSALGAKGIIYTTSDTSHIMLEDSPVPVFSEDAKTINVKSDNVSVRGTLLNVPGWQRQIIKLMKDAGGQVCLENIDPESSPIVETKAIGKFKLREASPEVFTNIMNGIARRLSSLSGSPTAVMRNFHGCYRFGPDVKFVLNS